MSKQIFQTNPLKLLINNSFSGTTCIQNLSHINKLYEIMKEAILQENNLANQNLNSSINTNNNNNISNNPIHANPINLHGITNIFTTSKPNRLFVTVKGQKIFNIVKENNIPNKRPVIYSFLKFILFFRRKL